LILSIIVLLGLLGLIFYQKGGRIQKVVSSKVNTHDIRSATIIDAIYGISLLIFTIVNPVPMSTTWAFIGVLGGRELVLKYMLEKKISQKTSRIIFADLGKVFMGFLISIFLVMIIRYLGNL
jgi:phosphate/sulfate permease